MKHIRDLRNQRFGRLVAINPTDDRFNKYVIWRCRCDCGNMIYVASKNLTSGATQSCGCLAKERSEERKKKNGVKSMRLYGVWSAMKGRCNNSNDYHYRDYGGRGITVCREWNDSFNAFKDWAIKNGYDENAPKGSCTLDRIDNNGSYTPQNCRWVSMKVQGRNRRTTRFITVNGATHSIAEWSELTGINLHTICKRINLGWKPEKIFSMEVQNGNCRNDQELLS